MTNGFGSERERIDRQMIQDHTEVGKDPITGDNIVKLPIFNVHDPKSVVKGRKAIVLKSDYVKHTLFIRKLYTAFDIGMDRQILDPRPFVYAGDPGAAYSKMNKKVRLAHLIKGLNDNPCYNDELDSIKTDPCSYYDNNMDNCVPHNIIVRDEDKISEQVKNVISSQNIEEVTRESIDVTDKIKKAIETNTTNKIISDMEQIILNGEKPTSLDATRDKEFRYYGVSKKMTGQGERFIANVKGQNLGTYMHPVDAARAVNDFVIDNGLPYPVNNIPGFLETKFIGIQKERSLTLFDTWELANEVSRRIMPDEMKF